eukprot:GEMP01024501.1.p1 GENE.GEMP01024501.1~~GEMP01024501.1.p1  ORF type:complete len:520 (+),score=110.99 GEMP01024501.1:118-1677(+)
MNDRDGCHERPRTRLTSDRLRSYGIVESRPGVRPMRSCSPGRLPSCHPRCPVSCSPRARLPYVKISPQPRDLAVRVLLQRPTSPYLRPSRPCKAPHYATKTASSGGANPHKPPPRRTFLVANKQVVESRALLSISPRTNAAIMRHILVGPDGAMTSAAVEEDNKNEDDQLASSSPFQSQRAKSPRMAHRPRSAGASRGKDQMDKMIRPHTTQSRFKHSGFGARAEYLAWSARHQRAYSAKARNLPPTAQIAPRPRSAEPSLEERALPAEAAARPRPRSVTTREVTTLPVAATEMRPLTALPERSYEHGCALPSMTGPVRPQSAKVSRGSDASPVVVVDKCPDDWDRRPRQFNMGMPASSSTKLVPCRPQSALSRDSTTTRATLTATPRTTATRSPTPAPAEPSPYVAIPPPQRRQRRKAPLWSHSQVTKRLFCAARSLLEGERWGWYPEGSRSARVASPRHIEKRAHLVDFFLKRPSCVPPPLAPNIRDSTLNHYRRLVRNKFVRTRHMHTLRVPLPFE